MGSRDQSQEDLEVQKQSGPRTLEETEGHCSNCAILGNSWVETLMLRSINIGDVTVLPNCVHPD